MRISGLASVFLQRFVNKLKCKSEQEAKIRYIMLEGLPAVQKGLPVRVVDDKLLTYLPAKDCILRTEEKVGVRIEA